MARSSSETGASRLSDKIDDKLPIWVFCWAVGLLATIFGAIMFALFLQINTIKDDKFPDLQSRLIVLETKFSALSAPVNNSPKK